MASVMTSQKNFYQHHVMKRVIHAVDTRGHMLDAINVLDVFCSCYAVISAANQT